MQFRTEIQLEADFPTLSLKEGLMSLGSCFSGHLGQKLHSAKFDILVDPLGTIYQAEMIFKLLRRSLEPKPQLSAQAWLLREGLYFHHDYHSSIHAPSKEAYLEKIQALHAQIRQQLLKGKVLFITLGTAVSHILKANQAMISNNHQAPSSQFESRLSSPKDIFSAFQALAQDLKAINPSLKFVFTLSPVRHTRLGLSQNSRSKAILRLAIAQICEAYAEAYYFPAYEIMMDDLRDYRFYEADMIHPNALAIQYIWEKFTESSLDAQAKQWLKTWEKLQKSLEHRAFHPQSQSHQQFLKRLRQELEQSQKQYSLNLENEIQQVDKEMLDS